MQPAMITPQQFAKSRQFIYQHARLLDRRRFEYHFDAGSKQAVLDALACYQNEDGGFASGLELDIQCPQSSGICTEVALGILLELDTRDGEILDRVEKWILSNQLDDGSTPHPTDEQVEAYPHGPWWKNGDPDRVFALAGLLGRLGRGNDEFFSRAAELFANTHVPLKQEIAVYSYPLHLYLNFAPGAERFTDAITQLKTSLPAMLDKEAWHCPLYFCSDRWYSPDIDKTTWQSEAVKAIATIKDDGGVYIEQYKDGPWWRPIWTLDMLIIMKLRGLLSS